jgi:hypothetical protein
MVSNIPEQKKYAEFYKTRKVEAVQRKFPGKSKKAIKNRTPLLERINKRYEKNMKRLTEIEQYYTLSPDQESLKPNQIFLNPNDKLFLSQIKRPQALSGYMMFAQKERARIQNENKDCSFGQLGRLVGQQWKTLSVDEQQQLTDMAWSNYMKLSQSVGLEPPPRKKRKRDVEPTPE